MGLMDELMGGGRERQKTITMEQLKDVKVRCFQVTRALPNISLRFWVWMERFMVTIARARKLLRSWYSVRRLVVGDIHGNYNALLRCLARCDFSASTDLLIGLGDYCDGYPDTAECLYLLSKLPQKVLVLGNHDAWLMDYLKTGRVPTAWTDQGGKATIASVMGKDQKPFDRLLAQMVPYYVTEDNKLFVHGGIDSRLPIEMQNIEEMLWDRDLVRQAYKYNLMKKPDKLTVYDEVFIGHTDTNSFKVDKPLCGGVCGCWTRVPVGMVSCPSWM